MSLLNNYTFAQTSPRVQKLNPTDRTFELQSPIQLNNQIIGSLAVTIDPQDNINLVADDLLLLLASRLTDEVLKELAARKVDGKLSASALRDADLSVEFDMSRLSLVIRVADSKLTQQLLSLETQRQPRSDIIQPATMSGFINLRSFVNHTESTDESDFRWAVDTEAQFRIFRPVLAVEGNFVESNAGDAQWIRRQTSVFYDLPDVESRFSIGDVFTSGEGFQSSIDVLGIQFGRDFQLSAGRNIRPLGNQQFSIDQPSVVSVIVDGLIIRTLELDAGRYDLRDIPLSVGSNFVTLEVESDTGEIEKINFESLFDNGLLDVDEIDFGMTGGVLAESGPGSRSYQTDEPALSLFGRTGIKPWLTAGINAQWTNDNALLGVQALSASPIGPFRLNIATSLDSQNSTAWALGVDFRSIQYGGEHLISSSFNAIYRGAGFDSVQGSDGTSGEQLQLELQAEYLLSAQSSIQWSGSLSSSLGFVLSDRGEPDGFNSSVFTSFSGRIPSLARVAWSARIELISEPDEDDEFNASVGVVYRPTRIDSVFSAIDSASSDSRFGYSRKTNSTSVGGYTTEIELRDNDDTQRTTFDAEYTANRFLTSFSVDTSDASDRSSTTTSTLRFDTSIAFADRVFGVGRPINDSFALVNSHKTLEGREIRVSPAGNTYTSRSTWFGAALVPGLGRNATKTIGFAVDDLPLGYDLGSGLFAVKPPEGAGYALTVGSAATVTVVGVLTDTGSGDALALVTGNVFSKEDDSLAPQIVFTNRTGKFAISGIAPGLYTLVLDVSKREVDIVVPDDGQTLLRLGDVPID